MLRTKRRPIAMLSTVWVMSSAPVRISIYFIVCHSLKRYLTFSPVFKVFAVLFSTLPDGLDCSTLTRAFMVMDNNMIVTDKT